jgi:hypothetical protein
VAAERWQTSQSGVSRSLLFGSVFVFCVFLASIRKSLDTAERFGAVATGKGSSVMKQRIGRFFTLFFFFFFSLFFSLFFYFFLS